MKKSTLFLITISVLFLSSCGFYNAGFRQNTGLGTKHVSTIATVKGGGNYCKH